MADIARRMNLDMLTLTGPIEPGLAAQGIDVKRDTEFMSLVEPDTVHDAYVLQMAAGTPVLVTATRGLTPAMLARHGFEDRLEDLAVAALTVARSVEPQHILVELWPCGLPLDPSSEASMKEHRDQYARVARVFEALNTVNETGATAFDGYLLGGFGSVAALKAAIAGVRKVTDRPVFASVTVDGEGYLNPKKQERIEDATAAAVEFGADVVGFATFAAPEAAVALARRIAADSDVPMMASLAVKSAGKRRGRALYEDPYATPETMLSAAAALREAGVQFLRATADASPAYTAVLAAATAGLDVIRRPSTAPIPGLDD